MKMIAVALLAVVALAAAAPADVPPKPIAIVRSEFDQQPDGPYSYAIETENGIIKSETGELKKVVDAENKPQEVVVVRGQYSFPGKDGKPITITYYADETGFHAEGESIPKVA